VRQYPAFLMAVTVVVAASACAKATTSGPAASPTPATVHVDLTHNQTTVTLRMGDSVVVDLPLPPKGSGVDPVELAEGHTRVFPGPGRPRPLPVYVHRPSDR
jgi:hypothetical protein